MQYPSQIEITPLTKPPRASVRPPGSKSITNRALVLAALAGNAPCTLDRCLDSEDTQVMLQCLAKLGYAIDHVGESGLRVHPQRRVPSSSAELFVGNSGTTMRFLTALLALGHGRYRLDGVPRMRERPIQDLLDALGQLGINVHSEKRNGCPPIVVEANGMRGGRVTIKGDVSSQFLSGLLMAAPFAEGEIQIEVVGPLVSVPYIDMTLAMMRDFGLTVEAQDHRSYRIPGNQLGGRSAYVIEPDASAASYFFGAAAITGGTITVVGLPRHSLQGDVAFIDVLEQMGCRVQRGDDSITVEGGALRGVDVDMNAISDTVMTLAVVACFAQGPTTIRNVGHIRHKETDRIAALATELRRVGAGVEEREDGLTIHPARLHGAVVQTYDDHRMAMSFSLFGLRVGQIIIDQPRCVTKTFPHFFHQLSRL